MRTDAKCALFLAFVSLGCAARAGFCKGNPMWVWIAYVLLGAWTIIPPLWFLHEWWKWKPDTTSTLSPAEQFAYLKHSHDLSSKFWIAFVLLLAAFSQVKLTP